MRDSTCYSVPFASEKTRGAVAIPRKGASPTAAGEMPIASSGTMAGPLTGGHIVVAPCRSEKLKFN
ncbi:hypothetical protein I6F26_18020 [Ensifer sp. IC3342]|nr:hypothetical protein [Ensifer sp. BRP08]MCA1448478.1 hypothetical protein [Ensifer sp. IC3342]